MALFTKDKDFYKRLFSLIIVIALQNLVVFSVNLADNVMLGGYSEAGLSGVALVNQIQFLLQMLVMGTAEGIVVLSARNHERDKVAALDAGADDYLTKPFGAAELLARIRTAIRHTRTQLPSSMIASSGKFCTGELVIDYDKHCVFLRGENARLTQGEYRIVALLGKYAGRVLTYDFMIRELWGPKAKSDNQILRVNMANIRRKIEDNPADPRYIVTEMGVGYRMVEGE